MEEQPPQPLPITLKIIFKALTELLPDNAAVIICSIRQLVVVPEETGNQYKLYSMGITKTGSLIVNEGFWNTYITNMDSLKTLMFHELLHQVAGDTYSLLQKEDAEIYPNWMEINQANNIAMDCRINAFIVNYAPEINPDKFLTDFYSSETQKQSPFSKLLMPNAVFNKKDYNDSRIEPYYNSFYASDRLCNHYELADIILEMIEAMPKQKSKELTICLGGHGGEGKSIEDMTDEELEKIEKITIHVSPDYDPSKSEANEIEAETLSPAKQAIKKAISDKLNEVASGAGKGAELANRFINLNQNITERLDISKFKKLAFDSIFKNVRTQAKVKIANWAASPVIPTSMATSDILFLSEEVPVILWKSKKYSNKIDKNLLPIYLDVSGSTYSYLPEIIKLISNVSDQLDYIWGFSTEVHKHTIHDLANGNIKTTGGTCFDCIVKHATENNFHHIVVISDGDAYCKTKGRHPNIKSVVTVLFGYSNKSNYFSQNYGNTYDISEVKI